MVEVKNYLRMLPAKFLSILYRTLCHIAEKCLVSVVTSTFTYLKNDWRLRLSCSLNDGLELLHVVKVECWNGISTSDSLRKHLTGVYKTKFFIRYHNKYKY